MKRMIALLAGTVALGVASPALADSPWGPLYLGAGAGVSWQDGTANFATAPDTNLSYHAAGRFSGALGYRWNNLRFELEPDWVTNNAGLIGFKGGTTVAAVNANIAYDYHLTKRWFLTAGAGIGIARVSHDVAQTSTNALFLGGQSTGLDWQVIGGIGYRLTHNIELSTEYRRMTTGNTSAVSAFGTVNYDAGVNNIVMANVRWYPFAEEEAPPPPASPPPPPPPPAPPPPPPPAPPPPPPVRTYVVYFDFNKTDLTAEARQIVSQAVQTVKQNGFARISVVGHTDTMGSAGYNQKLSERRATTVKDAMVGMGVSADAIATSGKGFSDPLVSTGPHVREPKNRRAVIDLGG